MGKRGGPRGRGGRGNYGGFNQYSNNGGGYWSNGGGFQDNYGNGQPHGMSPYNYNGGNPYQNRRGKNSNRGNYSHMGGYNNSCYNYNNNPEWYSDNGYGGDNCFNDGGFNMDEGYVYSHQMPNPFRNGQRAQGRNRGGMPRSKGGPQKEPLKKKWKKNQTTAAKPAANKQEAKKSEAKKGKRTSTFKVVMTLKNKYRSVRQNKHLTPDDQLVLVLLKKIAQETWQGPHGEVHFINFTKFASRHPNALKLFTYECKKQLDLKYANDVDEKEKSRVEYLEAAKNTILEGFKKVYKDRAANEDMDAKEAILKAYVAKLTGETFTDADIPSDSDYIFDPNHSRQTEVFETEFNYDFVFTIYECFRFKPMEQRTHSKDLNKRLRYHLDAKIIPFMIVESVKLKSPVKSLPKPLNEFIILQGSAHQERNDASFNEVITHMTERNENVVTSFATYIDNTVTTDVVRDFADCIIFFDRFATFTKFRMLDFTPNILLPKEQKVKLFDQLVDQIYREILAILLSKESLQSHVFPEMEKDEEFMQVQEEVAEVKEEPVEIKTEEIAA